MKRGQYNKLHPEHFDFGASLRKPYGVSSFNRVVRQYKASAARRGLVFTLTDEEIKALTSANCSYCGLPPASVMQMKDANGPYVYNGIDRRDSARGYVPDNCVTACSTCNKAKSAMPIDMWREWLARIIQFHKAEGEHELT